MNYLKTNWIESKTDSYHKTYMLTAVVRKLFETTTSIQKLKNTEPYIELKQCTPPKEHYF